MEIEFSPIVRIDDSHPPLASGNELLNAVSAIIDGILAGNVIISRVEKTRREGDGEGSIFERVRFNVYYGERFDGLSPEVSWRFWLVWHGLSSCRDK